MDAREDGKTSEESDTKDDHKPPDFLRILLKHGRPSSQLLSQLTWNPEAFGMAWLVLSSFKKAYVSLPLKGLDLSGCKLSPRRTFFLLALLPRSVETLIFGSSTVRGAALPLLCHFLRERLGPCGTLSGDGKERGGTAEGLPTHVKQLHFSAGSVGAEEAEAIMEALPVLPETLFLDGNPLGRGGAAAIAAAVRGGMASSLLMLSLDDTKIGKEGLGLLCASFLSAKPLPLQTLMLLQTPLCREGLSELCAVFEGGALPSLIRLGMGPVTWGALRSAWPRFVGVLKSGKLPSLQSWHLMDAALNDDAAVALAEVLRKEFLPNLVSFSLLYTGAAFIARERGAGALVSALSSESRPPLQRSHLGLRIVTEEHARMLASPTAFPFLRFGSLQLKMTPNPARTFFASLMERPSAVNQLDLELVGETPFNPAVPPPVVTALAFAIAKKRLLCLRRLATSGRAAQHEGFGPGWEEAKTSLLHALRSVRCLKLGELSLVRMGLGDADVAMLGDAVANLCFPLLTQLCLSGNDFGKEGMEGLMRGVSNRGLVVLLHLQANQTRGGEGLVSVASALRLWRMPNLRHLSLRDSGVADEGMCALGQAASEGRLQKLQSLDVGHNPLIGKMGMKGFMAGVSEGGLPGLKELSLNHTRAGEGVASLAAALMVGRLSRIATVDLESSGVNAEGIRVLGKAVRGDHLSKILSLSLASNETDEEGVESFLGDLAESALGFPSLQKLDLSNMPIGGKGITPLAAAIAASKLSNMQTLALHSCSLSDPDLRVLGGAFHAHPMQSLQMLSLEGNQKIGVEGLGAFLEALSPESLPKLRILNMESAENLNSGGGTDLVRAAKSSGKVRSLFWPGLGIAAAAPAVVPPAAE